MRIIVVGDIHGCAKALRGLLEAVAPMPDDQLIFLGDYVDRGPDSKGVLEILMTLSGQCKTVFLLGNHEIMFRGVLRGLDPQFWYLSGGRSTLTSYGGRIENVERSHIEFLDSCLPYFETHAHIFVHANFLPNLPLSEQPEAALFWEHLSQRIPLPHISGKHVFCGHTPQPAGRIGYYGHFTCLDTGCYSGFCLSAIDVNSGEIWQVSKEGHLTEQWGFLKRAWVKIHRFWSWVRS